MVVETGLTAATRSCQLVTGTMDQTVYRFQVSRAKNICFAAYSCRKRRFSLAVVHSHQTGFRGFCHFQNTLICDFSRALANGHGRPTLRDFIPPPPSRRMIRPSAVSPRRSCSASAQPRGTHPIPGCGFVQLLPCDCRSILHEKKEPWSHGPRRRAVEIECPLGGWNRKKNGKQTRMPPLHQPAARHGSGRTL